MTRFPGFIDRLPRAFYLLIIIGIAVLFSLSMLSGAFGKEARFPSLFEFQDGRLTMEKWTKSDKEDWRKRLAATTDQEVEPGFVGAVVMDCKVIKSLPPDKHHQPSWLVQPIHIYTGKEQILQTPVVIKSPTFRNSGLQLKPGEQYRLCAADLELLLHKKRGTFYFWGAVVPISQPRTARKATRMHKIESNPMTKIGEYGNRGHWTKWKSHGWYTYAGDFPVNHHASHLIAK